jgi:hypothetical protein
MHEGPYIKIGTVATILILGIAYLTLASTVRWPPFSESSVHSVGASGTPPASKFPATLSPTRPSIPTIPATSTSGPSPQPSMTVRPAPVQPVSTVIVGYGGKCLDVRGPSLDDGTPVQIWACNGVPEEQWTLTSGQLVGYGGKCLDVRGPSLDDGTPVQIWACNGVPEEQWTLTSGQLVGYGGKCLDVRGPSLNDGTPVQIWTCNGVPEEQWLTRR